MSNTIRGSLVACIVVSALAGCRSPTRRVLEPATIGSAGASPPAGASPASGTVVDHRVPFLTGLEVLARDRFAALAGRRVGVVTNPTGVDRSLRSLVDLLAAAPGVELAAIFGPEHGARGAAQAGEQVGDARDPVTGAPVWSLYGETRRPSATMLAGIDVLVFDVQDIGVRAYTYLSTLVEVLAAAAASGIEVWVLDRPVPIGADVFEGPMLEPAQRSFVGAHEVPLRHGLTAGEFARLVNVERRIGARLRVVAMEGYRRTDAYGVTGAPWVAPSPNIPTIETALVYGGTVLVEGVATLSEGRGTTRPFHLIGAPWLDARELVARLTKERLPGVLFRAAWFTPSASKYRDEHCAGVEIHVTDARAYRPVTVALAILDHARRLHPREFRWREDAFDRLAGTPSVRRDLDLGRSFREIVAGFAPALDAWAARRRACLLYD